MKINVYAIAGEKDGKPCFLCRHGDPAVFTTKTFAKWYLTWETKATRKALKLRVVKATLSVEEGE